MRTPVGMQGWKPIAILILAMMSVEVRAQKSDPSERAGIEQDFMEALRDDDVSRLTSYASQDPSIVSRRIPGWGTPLYIAISRADLKATRFLIEHKANLKKVFVKGDDESIPILVLAAGNTLLIDYLLEHGADVNEVAPDGTTPLSFYSAWRGGMQTEVVKELLDKGAKTSRSLSHVTKPETVALLVERGAKVNERMAGGRTPLITNVEGLETSQKTASLQAIKKLLELGADPNAADDHGDTALHHITDVAVAELLLQFKADPNKKNKSGRTPLDLVDRVKSPQPLTELHNFLVEHGAVASQSAGQVKSGSGSSAGQSTGANKQGR